MTNLSQLTRILLLVVLAAFLFNVSISSFVWSDFELFQVAWADDDDDDDDDPPPPVPVCGDNHVNQNWEKCDGNDFSGFTGQQEAWIDSHSGKIKCLMSGSDKCKKVTSLIEGKVVVDLNPEYLGYLFETNGYGTDVASVLNQFFSEQSDATIDGTSYRYIRAAQQKGLAVFKYYLRDINRPLGISIPQDVKIKIKVNGSIPNHGCDTDSDELCVLAYKFKGHDTQYLDSLPSGDKTISGIDGNYNADSPTVTIVLMNTGKNKYDFGNSGNKLQVEMKESSNVEVLDNQKKINLPDDYSIDPLYRELGCQIIVSGALTANFSENCGNSLCDEADVTGVTHTRNGGLAFEAVLTGLSAQQTKVKNISWVGGPNEFGEWPFPDAGAEHIVQAGVETSVGETVYCALRVKPKGIEFRVVTKFGGTCQLFSGLRDYYFLKPLCSDWPEGTEPPQDCCTVSDGVSCVQETGYIGADNQAGLSFPGLYNSPADSSSGLVRYGVKGPDIPFRGILNAGEDAESGYINIGVNGQITYPAFADRVFEAPILVVTKFDPNTEVNGSRFGNPILYGRVDMENDASVIEMVRAYQPNPSGGDPVPVDEIPDDDDYVVFRYFLPASIKANGGFNTAGLDPTTLQRLKRAILQNSQQRQIASSADDYFTSHGALPPICSIWPGWCQWICAYWGQWIPWCNQPNPTPTPTPTPTPSATPTPTPTATPTPPPTEPPGPETDPNELRGRCVPDDHPDPELAGKCFEPFWSFNPQIGDRWVPFMEESCIPLFQTYPPLRKDKPYPPQALKNGTICMNSRPYRYGDVKTGRVHLKILHQTPISPINEFPPNLLRGTSSENSCQDPANPGVTAECWEVDWSESVANAGNDPYEQHKNCTYKEWENANVTHYDRYGRPYTVTVRTLVTKFRPNCPVLEPGGECGSTLALRFAGYTMMRTAALGCVQKYDSFIENTTAKNNGISGQEPNEEVGDLNEITVTPTLPGQGLIPYGGSAANGTTFGGSEPKPFEEYNFGSFPKLGYDCIPCRFSNHGDIENTTVPMPLEADPHVPLFTFTRATVPAECLATNGTNMQIRYFGSNQCTGQPGNLPPGHMCSSGNIDPQICPSTNGNTAGAFNVPLCPGAGLGYDDVAVSWSPLILDPNGTPIRISRTFHQAVPFDIKGTGQRNLVDWPINSDEVAFLVMPDKKGRVHSIKQLFGDYKAKNGFESLRKIDSNKDGFVSRKDKKFKKLALWFDRNRDGLAQKDEMESLKKHGVEKIFLNYTKSGKEGIDRRTLYGYYYHSQAKTFRKIQDIYFYEYYKHGKPVSRSIAKDHKKKKGS